MTGMEIDTTTYARIKLEVTDDLGFRDGVRWINVHPATDCAKQKFCPIHKPSDWVANVDDWPYLWREDLGILERICPCGVGHPDRDSYEYLEKSGGIDAMIHGECGAACCAEPRRTVYRRWKGKKK